MAHVDLRGDGGDHGDVPHPSRRDAGLPDARDFLDSGVTEDCRYSDLDVLLLITTLFLVLLSAALVVATLARHVARRRGGRT